MNAATRLAGREDLESLGYLRWQFDHEGQEDGDPEARLQFIADFVESQDDRLFHWLAEVNGETVAVMSIRKVKKVPKLGALDRYWGYLTNCYVLPDYRNQGIGTELLSAVTNWAKEEQLELLIVWPSDRSCPFYDRAGFQRHPDPLVLQINDNLGQLKSKR